MPERLAYDEAMLFSPIRLKMPVPELKQGKVDILTATTKAGTIERPWGIEGGFAVVYKFRTRSGKLRALRCFRVPVNPDTQWRYQRIGPYFQERARSITVSFNYYVQGIAIKEQDKASMQVYPVIEMDWVDGITLLDHVAACCSKGDREELRRLSEQWLLLLDTLRQATIAHGDLAGANVMVQPVGSLVLIDYDGVYIPEFAGRANVLLGQVDYQHPQVGQRPFNEHMDDFSAFVIYTALLALSREPSLWKKYARLDARGTLLDTNLLFTQQDFQKPYESPLMRELEQLGDDRLREAVQELRRMCLQPVAQVRFPLHLIDPDCERKLALRRGVMQLRSALQNKRVREIADAYTAAEQLAHGLTARERQQAQLATAFVQACSEENDLEIAQAYEEINNFSQLGLLLFTPQQEQRAQLALKRRGALARFHIALASKRPAQIASAYNPILDESKNISTEERAILALARAYVHALADDHPEALLIAYDAIERSPHRQAFVFTSQEKQRIERAQREKDALITLQIALRQRDPHAIAAAYDPILDDYHGLTGSEREQIDYARAFIQACEANDDERLATVEAMLRQHPLFELTPREWQRLTVARQRHDALTTFRQALAEHGDDARRLVAAYDDALLVDSPSITAGERTKIASARRFLVMHEALQQALAVDNDRAIRASYDRDLARQFKNITEQEQQRIARSQLSQSVEDALDRRAYAKAIELACEIEARTGTVMEHHIRFKLQKALIRFVREHDIMDLTGSIERRGEKQYAVLRWLWPTEELIQAALVIWHPDHWPPHIARRGRLSSGGRQIWVERAAQSTEGGCAFPIPNLTHLYVQVYSGIQDRWSRQEHWRFSDGIAATSQIELHVNAQFNEHI